MVTEFRNRSLCRRPQGNLAADCIRNKERKSFVLVLFCKDGISVRTYANLPYGCNRLIELEFHRRESSFGSRSERERKAMDEDVFFFLFLLLSLSLAAIDVEVVV